MTTLIDLALECPVLPGYFFKRNGTFSVGTNAPPFYKGYKCKLNGLYYRRIKTIEGYSKMVHRMVAYTYCHNPCPDLFLIVDHIDGDTDHNADANLRWVNPILNVANSSARNTYISVKRPILIKGKRVWVNVEPRWESRITMKGKLHKLGYYHSEQEACDVSRAFRKRMWREIYLGYLKERNVEPEEASSFDIQAPKPPRVTARPSVSDPGVKWVGESRSARMCVYSPHPTLHKVPETKKKEDRNK